MKTLARRLSGIVSVSNQSPQKQEPQFRSSKQGVVRDQLDFFNLTTIRPRNYLVTGGTYFRSYDVAGDPSSGNMNSRATVSTFRLDKYEVTVGRFRAFVAANQGTQANPPTVAAGTHANIPGSGWEASWNTHLLANTAALVAAIKCDAEQTWTDMPRPNEDRPINCLTWYEAMAFCAWDGGYLPTEAERDYATTGGDQQRAYPWSSPAGSLTLVPTYASYSNGPAGENCVGNGLPDCAVTDMVPVGTLPAGDGRWGQSDLAGNVWEWTLDWYAPTYANPCVDCANLTPATYRTVGGGSMGSQDYHFYYTFGVRCARAP